VAAHPENTHAAKHFVYSERLREPRAREVAEQVLSAPWARDLDTGLAVEIGRLEALVEALQNALRDVGYKSAKAAKLIDFACVPRGG
jgi:hypothetical protein